MHDVDVLIEMHLQAQDAIKAVVEGLDCNGTQIAAIGLSSTRTSMALNSSHGDNIVEQVVSEVADVDPSRAEAVEAALRVDPVLKQASVCKLSLCVQ